MFYKFSIQNKGRKYFTGTLNSDDKICKLRIDSVTDSLSKETSAFIFGSFAGSLDRKILTAKHIFKDEDDFNSAQNLLMKINIWDNQALKVNFDFDKIFSGSEDYIVKEYRGIESRIEHIIQNEGWITREDIINIIDFIALKDTLSESQKTETSRLESFSKNGINWGFMAFNTDVRAPINHKHDWFDVCIRGAFYRLTEVKTCLYETMPSGVEWGEYLSGKKGKLIRIYRFDILDQEPLRFEFIYLDAEDIPSSQIFLI